MIIKNRNYNKPNEDVLTFVEQNVELIDKDDYFNFLKTFFSPYWQSNYYLYESDYVDLCDMILEDTLGLPYYYVEELRWEVFDSILIDNIDFWKQHSQEGILYPEDFIPQMYGRHGFTDEQIIEHLDKYSESKFMGCYLANESDDDSEEDLIYIIKN